MFITEIIEYIAEASTPNLEKIEKAINRRFNTPQVYRPDNLADEIKLDLFIQKTKHMSLDEVERRLS